MTKFHLLNRNSQIFRSSLLETDKLLVNFFRADIFTLVITSSKRNVTVLLLLPPKNFKNSVHAHLTPVPAAKNVAE